jgi:hypothetical protein
MNRSLIFQILVHIRKYSIKVSIRVKSLQSTVPYCCYEVNSYQKSDRGYGSFLHLFFYGKDRRQFGHVATKTRPAYVILQKFLTPQIRGEIEKSKNKS